MYVLKLKELKANLTQQKIQKGNVASVTASYELSQMIVINGKSYTEGDFIKQYFAKMAEIVCPEKACLFKNISLTRNICWTEHTQWFEATLKSRIIKIWTLAIDETIDITGITQLAVFIRDGDNKFNIYEELITLIPMPDTTTSQNIFVFKDSEFRSCADFSHKDSERYHQLLKDLDNEFIDVLFYAEVHWLSCHKVLKRFYWDKKWL